MKKNKKKDKSALHISKGVEEAATFNPQNIQKFRRKKRTVTDYVSGILRGDRVLLSQAITLIESTRPQHQQLAQQIVEQCLAHSSKSIRIGITGTPGVGKSTFIESFGKQIITEGSQLAVLAIDPSSQLTKGSILGDKTRMQELSVCPEVFIRPSPAGGSLGGVARKTRESIVLCEAAGFDTILVETVGVGQSETAVHSMVDFFLLLLLPNSGDELQGIKRGVMEMADLVVINKADGDAITAAKLARKQCRNALHLFPPKPSGWIAGSVICSALRETGLVEIWKMIGDFRLQTTGNGYFDQHRAQQALYWLHESIGQQLKELFYQMPTMQVALEQLEQQILERQISSFRASELLMQAFKEQLHSGHDDAS